MKYLPTINLWATGMENAVLCGQLKLQCGQWIQCGPGTKSRYIGTNGLSINAAHGGNHTQVCKKFFARAAMQRVSKIEDRNTWKAEMAKIAASLGA